MQASQNNGKRSAGVYGRLFRNRNFVALWLGQTISFVGDYFYILAVPIMVERLTGSMKMVGLSVIFNALPMLLLGPVAGVFVDRWDRKRTMIVSDILRGLLVLTFLTVRTADQVWVYYLAGFLMSCVGRFFFPSQNAMLPLIVRDEDDLLAANGLMQMVQTVGFLAGPAMAGFAIGFWGEQVAFIFDSLTFVISAGAILTMTVPRTRVDHKTTQGRELASVWADMRDGIRYLFGNQTMVGILISLAVIQLGVGAIHVVWIPYLQRTFGVGAEGLGIVDSAQGGGMLLGAVLLGFLSARLPKRVLIAWSIVLIGLFFAGIGMAPTFGLIVAINFSIGVMLVPAQSGLMAMMQLAVPNLKRGRVSSTLNALTTAAGLLSMAAAASLADQIGPRPIYIICGLIIATGGLVGLAVLKEPELQPIRQPIDPL